MGILYSGSGSAYASIGAAFTPLAGYSFLAFNLLCAPACRNRRDQREMNSCEVDLVRDRLSVPVCPCGRPDDLPDRLRPFLPAASM